MSEHGTRARYVRDKCRCTACRTANAEYQADLVARLAERNPANVPHGIVGGYTNWGCRCEVCTAASTRYHRGYEALVASSLPAGPVGEVSVPRSGTLGVQRH